MWWFGSVLLHILSYKSPCRLSPTSSRPNTCPVIRNRIQYVFVNIALCQFLWFYALEVLDQRCRCSGESMPFAVAHHARSFETTWRRGELRWKSMLRWFVVMEVMNESRLTKDIYWENLKATFEEDGHEERFRSNWESAKNLESIVRIIREEIDEYKWGEEVCQEHVKCWSVVSADRNAKAWLYLCMYVKQYSSPSHQRAFMVCKLM